MVLDAIRYRDGKEWEVIAVSLMPNHVHLVLRHLHPNMHMGTCLRHFKSFTATMANRILGTKGAQFWEHENFDTVIRTERELRDHIRYTLRNPVIARLCKSWQGWPGSYCSMDYRGIA